MSVVTHGDLHAALRQLGWRREVRRYGRVDHYLTSGPCDRMIATIPQDPENAMCETRGAGRAVTSVAEALDWATACEGGGKS